MKIEFTDEQFNLLKGLVSEYIEDRYQEMLELKRMAMDAHDAAIAREYDALAVAEEAHFSEAKALGSYIEKYEALFGGS